MFIHEICVDELIFINNYSSAWIGHFGAMCKLNIIQIMNGYECNGTVIFMR